MNIERTSNELYLLEDLFSREASAVPSNDEGEDMVFGDYTKQRILILLSARTETTENLQPIGRRRHQASR